MTQSDRDWAEREIAKRAWMAEHGIGARKAVCRWDAADVRKPRDGRADC